MTALLAPQHHFELVVARCTRCKALTFPGGMAEPGASGEAPTKCCACGSTELECDHPGSVLIDGFFICGTCGQPNEDSTKALKRGLETVKHLLDVEDSTDNLSTR